MAPRIQKPTVAKPAKPAKAEKLTKAEKPVKPPKPAKPVAAKPAIAKPTVVARAASPEKAGIIRLKDLVEQVASATGAKKPDARKSVEAVLSAMGAALTSGAALAVPPLGKLRVAKAVGGTLTLKLRTPDASGSAAKPLAEDGEDD